MSNQNYWMQISAENSCMPKLGRREPSWLTKNTFFFSSFSRDLFSRYFQFFCIMLKFWIFSVICTICTICMAPFVQVKKRENTHWGVLILVKLQAKVFFKSNTHFSRFLNCTNGTKSRKAFYFVPKWKVG